ncbi:hypothetical protein BF49_2548 [Bradyrhizobium sp.]|uniref:hypothetical protein n=1 Tax=Bradyrhizobium sp. TaxID=376 RepID=UPI0007C1DC19|nr:hypothetical protein [Bradyrhizobium sp.]CUT11468.1 hypothetical protein BF49_2548 [Bradyrhizobium sp.]
MSEVTKALTDLPPSEFGPHGRVGLDDTMFSAPIPTVCSTRAELHRAALALEALKIVEFETPAIQRAITAVRGAFADLDEHAGDVIAQGVAEQIAGAGLH